VTRPSGRTAACLALVGLLAACRATDSTGGRPGPAPATGSATSATSTTSATSPTSATPDLVESLRAEIVNERPRGDRGFTQGLELDGGVRYESNGLYGASVVRAVDDATGTVLRTFTPPVDVFAEGITKVDDTLVLLTWRERRAFVLDAVTLTERRQLAYDTEGWGICARDDEVVTSDGSDTLTVRDPKTLTPRRTVQVRLRGTAVPELNELECVGDHVWANVWRTDRIVRIRVADGTVTGVADLPELRPDSTRPDADAVLNGIAHDGRSDTFLLTGKRWPVIYEVRFVKAGS
jgi:glutamine cyclotransferase